MEEKLDPFVKHEECCWAIVVTPAKLVYGLVDWAKVSSSGCILGLVVEDARFIYNQGLAPSILATSGPVIGQTETSDVIAAMFLASVEYILRCTPEAVAAWEKAGERP